MADKQIIDGCECKWWKQLKAKEQECEELKNIINEAKNSKLDLNSFFAIEAIVGEYQLELDQLKAEVKSKTEYIQEQRDIINQYSKEIEMYKKCQGKRASKREEELKAENDKYSLFIEKLCDYAGLECDDEEQAMRTLSDLASQMNKARWIIDRYKQTLTEIKEIAEEWEGAESAYMVSSLILQKISECEVE